MADPFADARVLAAEQLSSGYTWAECPRWHDGALWFSDMYAHRIVRLDDDGTPHTVLDLSRRTSVNGTEVIPGGFGWLPDGRLIVTSMHERLVLAFDGEQVTVHADLRGLASGPINDMVVDGDGRAYVTQLGFELFQGEEPRDSPLLVVERAGTAHALTDLGGMSGANGIAITADGSRVLTAEAFANRITVLDRDKYGRLTGRRVFAETPSLPDGICLDDDGGVWAGMPGVAVARFADGGAITDVVPFDPAAALPPACVLGGADRRTLYICAGLDVMDWEESRRNRRGTIWQVPVRASGGANRP
ncbi:Gluconolactonase [[Actinomadura] parvosata subsp. kistnae]|uniref:Lactone hydrolase n=1 Tax=[Actinomadura] parvosata subsp. kistnae TaxID=1909395 RepID=A0A1U9ZWM0_9ACTN|nr:SMP-30/gluconolactonase/LRE family protein [Nonomuraea sp. ATCC 55076]AQZ62309.1 lactone hydrolase [Nonomuraea sp. ATCC 55076]SPL99687.1 Gluconolactonase [Actinomadura parvosata subsp. kistnae]